MNDPNYYYLDRQQTPQGPHTLQQLIALREAGLITDATLVAAKGDPAWEPFSSLYTSTAPPDAAPVEHPPIKPPSYLIGSILCTLFCCLPLGVLALINSCRVNALYNAGRYEEAEQASQSARWLCILGVILAPAVFAITCIW